MLGSPHTSSSTSRQLNSDSMPSGTTVLKPLRMARACRAPSPSLASTTRRQNVSTSSGVTCRSAPPSTSSTSLPPVSCVVNVWCASTISSAGSMRSPCSACTHSLSTSSRSRSVISSPSTCFHTVDGRSSGSVNLVRSASPMSAPTHSYIAIASGDVAAGLMTNFSRFSPVFVWKFGQWRNSGVALDMRSAHAMVSDSRYGPPTSMLPSPAKSTAHACQSLPARAKSR
mmetsp:Transcript_10940/g.38075  ORF Transcript_10940/g.38075 Transcript_10940/m.38075 type:complete len:228 (-) Transcript_10940:337-1020(-)